MKRTKSIGKGSQVIRKNVEKKSKLWKRIFRQTPDV